MLLSVALRQLVNSNNAYQIFIKSSFTSVKHFVVLNTTTHVLLLVPLSSPSSYSI